MNYLLFYNDIIISDGHAIKRIGRGPGLKEVLGALEKVSLCCVDVDVMIASAPEDYVDRKDALLGQKFREIYADGYITLNEKIGNNIFQVFGIKAAKIKEIYELIPSSNVAAFVPYAHAIRSFLARDQVDMNRLVVFVDDMGPEKLLTVFDGQKFSRTRTVRGPSVEDILPDIKRSSIDFNKKLGEFASKANREDMAIITNNRQLADGIRQAEPGLAVDFVDARHPALEGLAVIDRPVKYRIPEEIIAEQKKKELRSWFKYLMLTAGICMAGILYAGFNQITYLSAAHELQAERSANTQLNEALNTIDPFIYRDALRRSKGLNYSSLYYEIYGLLPSAYETASFKFTANGGHWVFDTYVFAQDDQLLDDIPRVKILKGALIKDFFIKNRPGKYVRVSL